MWLEEFEQAANFTPSGFDRTRFGFTEVGFQLGEDHLDRVQIRTVGRQKQKVGAGLPNGLAGALAFVASEVVDNHDVARLEPRNETLLHPGREQIAVDRAVEDAGCHDGVMPEAADEGQGLPVTLGNLGLKGQTARAPAMDPGHVGFDPGLVHEDQPFRRDAMLVGLPALTEPRDGRPLLLAGDQRFF